MFRLFKRNREAIKKYLLAAFLAIMALGMVGVVTPFFSGGDSSRVESGTLAEIEGQRITAQELQQAIQSRFRNSPVGYDPRIVPAVAGSVLDEMVLRRALEVQARTLGLEVTDRELRQSLQSMPGLASKGTFVGMDRYREAIRQTGMSVSEFEAQLRESLLLEKIRDVVTDGLRVSPAEVQQEFQKRNEKAKIEYVLFEPSEFLKAVDVSPQALETFFKKDPERYKVPERRRVRYALIDPDSVRAQVKVSDDEVRQYYTQHLAEYRVPERVKVAHILFKTTGKSPAEAAALEKTAQDVLPQIKSGKDFAELARKYSEDSSASNGGDLGWIVRGQTVKEFEDTAFAMKPGLVSALVKTIYGIHILKILDKQTAHLQSLDEVKNTIRAKLEKDGIDSAEQSLAQRLEGELKGNGQSFDAVTKKAGLEVKSTPPFRYGEKLPDFGASESFAELAFQLSQGKVGPPITVPKGIAIIEVSEVAPEHVPKLDEVRPRVEQDYRAEQSRRLASEKARAFASKVKSGDFKKVAKAEGLKVKESKDFTQQDSVEDLIPGSSVAAAFTLAPGESSDAVQLGTPSVVFRVVSRTPANEADFPAQQDRIREEILERKRTLAFEIYRQNLKEALARSGRLKVNDLAMKQFLAPYQTR